MLELCGLVRTRVIDLGGVYDPSVPNDRLLRGLKGTMSEFELTLMRRRLIEGIETKARRGEYRVSVPVGYLWTRETGLELDPGRRVQEAIRTVFRLFERFESGRQVLLHMVREGLRFPRPVEGRRHGPPWQWRAPVYRNIIAVLRNPFYAGAYAYGKSTHRTTLVDGRLAKTYGHDQPMAVWRVLLRDHHAGYITWTEFERNHERLRQHAFRKPAGRRRRGGTGAHCWPVCCAVVGVGACSRSRTPPAARWPATSVGSGTRCTDYRCVSASGGVDRTNWSARRSCRWSNRSP